MVCDDKFDVDRYHKNIKTPTQTSGMNLNKKVNVVSHRTFLPISIVGHINNAGKLPWKHFFITPPSPRETQPACKLQNPLTQQWKFLYRLIMTGDNICQRKQSDCALQLKIYKDKILELK